MDDTNKKNWKRYLVGDFTFKRLILSALFIYLSLLLFVWLFDDYLLWHPPEPATYSDTNEIIKIKTDDGITISAVYIPNPDAEFTILYSHGNGEDLGICYEIFHHFIKHDYSVLAYDYRGYGTSEGKTSESGVYQDIEAVYSYALLSLGIKPETIIVFGRSIGSGPSVHLAVNKPIGGLVLESAFARAFQTITRFRISLYDKFKNIDKISFVTAPVLIIHSRDDTLVPFWNGEKLYEKANHPKMNFWVEGPGHNDYIWDYDYSYWNTLKQFAEMIKKPDSQVHSAQ